MKKIKDFLNTHTKKVVLGLVITTIIILVSSRLGDWRKGSSATLQANISLDASAFRNSTPNDSIHVYQGSDYKQCVKSVVIQLLFLFL